jgi:hypothetical protein
LLALKFSLGKELQHIKTLVFNGLLLLKIDNTDDELKQYGNVSTQQA